MQYETMDREDDYHEASWEDLKAAVTSVQLLRNQLEDWVEKPFFDDTVVGCFVRVNIGVSRDQESSYRLCEIVGIKEDESSVAYKLSSGTFTRKKLTVRLGSARKSWPMTQISNSEANPKEIDTWKSWCERDNVNLPAMAFLEDQRVKIDKAVNFVYDNEVIDSMVAGGETHKQGNFAIQRSRLTLLRDAAQQSADQEEFEKWSTALRELEEREHVAKQRRSDLEMQGLGVSHINQRHALRNFTIEREVGIVNSKERVDMIVNERDDPHLRRPTRNICYFDMPNQKDKAEDKEKKDEAKSPKKVVKDEEAEEEEKTIANALIETQLKKAHEFNLGLDLEKLIKVDEDRPALCPSASITRLHQTQRTFGSSYSLAEYNTIKETAV